MIYTILSLLFSFESVGKVSCTNPSLQKDLLSSFIKNYKDLKGRHLKLVAIDNWPWLHVNDVEGAKIIIGGIDFNILKVISKKLNFK